MATTYSANATFTARVQANHIQTDEIAPTRDVVDRTLRLQVEGIDLTFRQSVTESDLIDFTSFVDGFGRVVAFEYIKSLFIQNTSTNQDGFDVITLGEVNDLPGIPEGIIIPPGGMFMLTIPGEGIPVGPTGSIIIAGEENVSADIVAVGVAL